MTFDAFMHLITAVVFFGWTGHYLHKRVCRGQVKIAESWWWLAGMAWLVAIFAFDGFMETLT